MMYMDDLVRGTVELITAPEKSLKQRVFNMAAISFTPKELFNEIKKHYPSASITYSPDERQTYADSWPKTLQDPNAREQWGWNHEYDIAKMSHLEVVNFKKSNQIFLKSGFWRKLIRTQNELVI